MANLSEKLKHAREAKKISLEKANQETKIHLRVLNAFEQGKFDVLSPTYIKSFLKKYSQYLGLDPEEVLAEFMKACPQKATVLLEPVTTTATHHTHEPQRKPINFKPFKIAAIVTVCILGAYFIIVGGHKAFVSISSKIKSAPKKVKVVQKQKPKPKPNFPVIPSTSPLKLIVSVSDEAWLQLKCDGKTIFQDVLPAASIKKIEAQKSIELWTGKGQAVLLELNGYNLGSPGQGVIKGMVITRDGIKRK